MSTNGGVFALAAVDLVGEGVEETVACTAEMREPQYDTTDQLWIHGAGEVQNITKERSPTHHRLESHQRRVRGRSAMGTPRRTVPSLSKREGDLRGVSAAGMGEARPLAGRQEMTAGRTSGIVERKKGDFSIG